MPGESPRLVQNRRSRGRPVTRGSAGSARSASGIHCLAPDQGVPGLLLACAGQVDRVDPVRDPPRAGRVPALHPGGAGALLLLARLVQPGRRVPPDLAYRRKLVLAGPVQQPLRLARRPVAGVLGDRPTVPRRQVTGQRVQVLPACSHVCVRLKRDRSRPVRADRSRTALEAPILAAAAASVSFVLTS